MDRWYRLNEAVDDDIGTERRPDFEGLGDEINAWSGNTPHPDGAPYWVVRVSADESVHEELEDSLSQDARALDNVPVEALNNMFGQNRSEEGWNRVFNVQG